MISKSLFTNRITNGDGGGAGNRLLFEPVVIHSSNNNDIKRKNTNVLNEIENVITNVLTNTIIEYVNSFGINPDFVRVKTQYMDLLRTIQENYGLHSASRNFELISQNQGTYADLYDRMTDLQASITDDTMSLLLTLAKETLITSFYSVTLHVSNASLLIEKNVLQQKVNDLINDVNSEIIQNTNVSGQFGIVRNVQLAPVYSYYIAVYGIPVYGAGFDPIKISFLAEILTNLGITPYN